MRSILICFAILFVSNINAQEIPYKLEELTAPDFVKAVDKSSKTVILPIDL